MDWYRQLPWQYVKWDNDSAEWDIEPLDNELFTSSGDGSKAATFAVTQVSTDRGKIVGFEILDSLSKSQSEALQAFGISDGWEDTDGAA